MCNAVGFAVVIHSPRSVFFRCRKMGYRLWVIPLALLSEPMLLELLNSFSSKICHQRQNTQFNMYTTTSKEHEGSIHEKILIQNVL